MSRILMALCAIAFLSAPAYAADDPTIAIVNGHEIKKSEAMDLVKTLPPMAQQAPFEKIYPMVMDQLINAYLISEAAGKSKIADKPEIKEKVAMAKEQIVQSAFLEEKAMKMVTDAKMKEAYNEFKKANKDKKETRARHILVETEDEAKAIVKSIKDGAKFEDVAKEKSIGPTGAKGGDLGYFTEEAMVPEFSKAAFAGKVGKLIETPVQTQFGWHVIKVEDRRAIKLPTFDELKPGIQQKLGQEALQDIIAGLRKGAEIKRFDMDGKALN